MKSLRSESETDYALMEAIEMESARGEYAEGAVLTAFLHGLEKRPPQKYSQGLRHAYKAGTKSNIPPDLIRPAVRAHRDRLDEELNRMDNL